MITMKKLYPFFLFVLLGLTASSCSDDSSQALHKPSGNLTMTVDGAQKFYNNLRVEEIPQNNGSIQLKVTASQNGNPSEVLIFRVKKGETGVNHTNKWIYSSDSNVAKREVIEGEVFDIYSNISQNGQNRLRGTFNGRLFNTYSNRIVTIDEGEFDYRYNLPQQ